MDTSIFNSEFLGFITALMAVCFAGSVFVKRATAWLYERKISFIDALSGDAKLIPVALLSIAYTAFVVQPRVLANAETLTFLPNWQLWVGISVGTFILAAGGVDAQTQAVRREAQLERAPTASVTGTPNTPPKV